jgi:hypothetical protein
VTLLPLLIAVVCAGEPQVDAEFPGGNLVVERIEGNDVWVHQDLRDTPRFWFWWNCRVRGAAGRTLTFHFTQGNVFGPRGPAVSRDSGKTWDWLGIEACDGDNFACSFADDEMDTRLAFAIPYTAATLDTWREAHRDNPHVVYETLTRSNHGRDVPLLRVGCVDGSATRRVLITCRHHACESLAGFVAEGMMSRFLDTDDDAAWLRSNVELIVAPIMDTDGVEQGDQGKLRQPHDHWLDYGDDSRYAEVRALKQRWIDHPLPVDIALDVHCPSIRDKFIYFATGPDPAVAESTARLSAALEAVQSGPLKYATGRDQPYGKGWNRAETYVDVRSFMHWADGLPGIKGVATLEFPYAVVGEETVTVDRARQFGSDLAGAIARCLREAGATPRP